MNFSNPRCWITGQSYLVFCKRDVRSPNQVRRVVVSQDEVGDLLEAEHRRLQNQVNAMIKVAASEGEKKLMENLYLSEAFDELRSATIAASSSSSSSSAGALVGIITNKKQKKHKKQQVAMEPVRSVLQVKGRVRSTRSNGKAAADS